MVKYVIYKSEKPLSLAFDTIEDRVETLLEEFDLEMFQKLCGTLFYAMLCNIPDYDLEDGNRYTIEMICFNTSTTLAHSVHTYLDIIGDIAVKGVTVEALHNLLSIEDVLSVIALCNTEMRKIYCIFVAAYAKCINDFELFHMAMISVEDAYAMRQLRNMFGG